MVDYAFGRTMGNGRRGIIGVITLLTLGFVLSATAPCSAGEDAQKILEAADVLIRGEQSAFYNLTMTVEKPDWRMTCEFNLYLKGADKAFGCFLSPPEDKDIAYLRIGYDMWTYVPHFGKIVKMPPAMMQEGLMSGNLSSYDLIRLTSISDIFTPVLTAKEVIDGEEMAILELTPKNKSAAIHGKLKMWISEKEHIPFKMEYYTKKDELLKTLYYKKREKMGGRIIPVLWEMVSAGDQPIRTLLTVSDAKFNIPMDDDVFTQLNLTTLSKLPVTAAGTPKEKITDSPRAPNR
jgi:outer membrane lipoprotein-sorting protein